MDVSVYTKYKQPRVPRYRVVAIFEAQFLLFTAPPRACVASCRGNVAPARIISLNNSAEQTKFNSFNVLYPKDLHIYPLVISANDTMREWGYFGRHIF